MYQIYSAAREELPAIFFEVYLIIQSGGITITGQTKTHPKGKLVGRITNIDEIDFSKDGIYQVDVEGELSIKGVTKPISEKGTITVKGGNIGVESKFNVTLADYGISFVKGKPSTNVAKEVEVTVLAEYQAE